MLDELEDAGIVERYVNPAGEDAMRLTNTGSQIANQLAMMGDEARDQLIDALLGGEDDDTA